MNDDFIKLISVLVGSKILDEALTKGTGDLEQLDIPEGVRDTLLPLMKANGMDKLLDEIVKDAEVMRKLGIDPNECHKNALKQFLNDNNQHRNLRHEDDFNFPFDVEVIQTKDDGSEVNHTKEFKKYLNSLSNPPTNKFELDQAFNRFVERINSTDETLGGFDNFALDSCDFIPIGKINDSK